MDLTTTLFVFNSELANDMHSKPDEGPTNPAPESERGRPHHSRARAQHDARVVPLNPRARNGNGPSADPNPVGSYTIEHRHGCAVVVASGEIDLTTAPALRHTLEEASKAATRIVVDMSLVVFIDSSGLAVLLDAYKHRRLDHHLVLCLGRTRTIVRRVLDTTRINTMLPTYDTLAEAIASLT